VIVDTSALVAILRREPEREALLAAIMATPRASMSAATELEASIVVDAINDPVLSRQLDELIAALDIDVVDVTDAQVKRARQAFRDFGKGRHRAGLNYGDCFTYGLTAERREPLLCKGDDFRHTDLEIVDLSGGDD
jgi:ribonuclease VapC